MTDLEKLRKRTREIWKREVRTKYSYLMSFAKMKIEQATRNSCSIKRKCGNGDYFPLWIVSKKLESKGFRCELEKGTFTFSGIFYYDTLYIYW